MAERADGSLSVARDEVPLVSVLGAKRGSWTAGCALNCMAIFGCLEQVSEEWQGYAYVDRVEIKQGQSQKTREVGCEIRGIQVE